ncbi:30S ribosomal protein S1 [Coprothermobacteraceae bacterium]|nr:30S ribosomal protein S1 [Coprothermobacteraceae bacterium]
MEPRENNFNEEFDVEIAERGDVVEGRVLRVDVDGLWLDIGSKYDAFLSLSECTPDLADQVRDGKVPETITVVVTRSNDEKGYISVSQKRAAHKVIWRELEQWEKSGEVKKVKAVDADEKGLFVDLGGGIRGYVPASQIDTRFVRDPKRFVGRTLRVKILRLNRRRNQIILSQREVIEAEQKERAERAWQKLRESEVVRGHVVKVTDEGIVVDLGEGITGFVPKDELDWRPIRNIARVFRRGDVIKAKVLAVDEAKKEMTLSIRLATPNPWHLFAEKHSESDIVNGRVLRYLRGGLLLLVDRVTGFVPPHELSWKRGAKVEELFKIGDHVKAKILKLDSENQDLLLSVKEAAGDPWDNVEKEFPVGARVQGKVVNITDFGVFVELAPGVEGLVPRRYVSWKKFKSIEEVVKVGDSVEVVVLGINHVDKKITLSIRDTQPDPWEETINKIQPGQLVRGKVVTIIPQGVFVEIAEGVEGFIPVSQLSVKRIQHPEEVVKEGQEVVAKVIGIDEDRRRISLSVKAIHVDKEKEELQQFFSQQGEDKITLSDILGNLLGREVSL